MFCNNQKMVKFSKILTFFFILKFFLIPLTIIAQEMTSPNYRIWDSSINIGGTEIQTSTNYKLKETIGEIAPSFSTSTIYKVSPGYRAMQEAYIALSLSTTSVTLLPIITANQNVATGTFAATVITDNLSGFSLYVKANTSPVLQSSSDSFLDYTPAVSGIPDYNWSIAPNSSEFGFTPEGADIVQKYKDDGISNCNSGSSDTADKCWYNFSTSNELISKSTTPNNPNGSTTIFKLRAEKGINSNLTPGNYTGVLIITAVAN
jgi:hypothetical protein